MERCLRFALPTLLLPLLLIMSCSDTTTSANNNTNEFTPPTSLIFKIDGAEHSSSMDAVNCDINGGNVSLSKPFNSEYAALRIRFSEAPPTTTGYRNITSQIEEGKYKVFYISSNSLTRAADSVGIELDQVPYYYKGTTGRLYVSKLNGKLRYTTDGEITATGQKYVAGAGLSGSYSKKLEFSVQCGEQ